MIVVCRCGVEFDDELTHTGSPRTRQGVRRKSCSRYCYRRGVDQRKYWLKGKYGLTVEEWEEMYDSQGGSCASCGRDFSDDTKFRAAVDHDHTTGKVRALLCNRCNRAIGLLEDDVELVDKAAAYLRSKVDLGV